MLKKLNGQKISEEATVGKASIKGPVWIGKNAVIESGAEIRGPAVIGADCHIGSRAVLTECTVLQPNVKVDIFAKIISSIVFQNTYVGKSSYLSNCVVAEGCTIGSNVMVEEMSLIGAECEIGDGAQILHGSKVWSKIKIDLNSITRGIVNG